MRLLILILSVIVVHSTKLRIMPLGDSLTVGEGVEAGYRKSLFYNLQRNGYDVEFVGSSTENSSNEMPIVDHHEGHGYWKINRFIEFGREIFETAGDLDVILVMIGTEDMRKGAYLSAINRLDALLLNIATLQPYAHIIVSNLLPLKKHEWNNIVNDRIELYFNAYVPATVRKHRQAGRKVDFVDSAKHLGSTYLEDWKHLNEEGYSNMGNLWAKAIKRNIGPNGDSYPPQPTHAEGSTNGKQIILSFSKPLSDDSTNITNFLVKEGLQIINATLDDEKRKITLNIANSAQQNEIEGAGRDKALGFKKVTILGGITDRTEKKLSVQSDTQIEYTESWRFIVLSDWHSAEKYVFNSANSANIYAKSDIEQDLRVIQYLHSSYRGEFVMIPGDTNNGQWTKKDFQKKFLMEFSKGKTMTSQEIVLAAGSRCYGGMLRSFRLGGYAKVLLSHGDHEAGDNPCKFLVEFFTKKRPKYIPIHSLSHNNPILVHFFRESW